MRNKIMTLFVMLFMIMALVSCGEYSVNPPDTNIDLEDPNNGNENGNGGYRGPEGSHRPGDYPPEQQNRNHKPADHCLWPADRRHPG